MIYEGSIDKSIDYFLFMVYNLSIVPSEVLKWKRVLRRRF